MILVILTFLVEYCTCLVTCLLVPQVLSSSSTSIFVCY